MNLEHLHPFAGQHAIQSAVFAIDFASELNVGEVGALRQEADKLAGDFPVVNDQQLTTLSMQVVSGEEPVSSANTEFGGFVMERPALISSEPKRRFINVSRNSIIVVINDYTRWDKFKSDIDRYISVLLAPIDSQKAITGIGLQFNDVFFWRADPAELKIEEVFVANNPYIAPNIFSSPFLWHSHHGYLTSNDNPIRHHQLDNVNVSRVEANEQHQLQILTSHRATFDKPLYKSWSDNKANLFIIQDGLHEKNKLMLTALLTPAVQEKISLNASKEL